ncbi:MAG: ABC transporter permease [Cohaesibacter sp.]|jgi:putative ABC transport system permease protein|nr:ABC transporter permease [Cohaesibacter sp.]
MTSNIHDIPLQDFLILALPSLPVLVMLYVWQLNPTKSLYAMGRMLLQLITIGYVLNYIFTAQHSGFVMLVLVIMMAAATWISLNPLKARPAILYRSAFLAIALGGTFVLLCVTQGILKADPWYNPRLIIPLSGMVYVVSMTSISQSAERLIAELQQSTPYEKARKAAINAAMIPTINAMFAVGLVSLPGMMTGQILSGISPLIAVKYQIAVMIMSFCATGLATILFIALTRSYFEDQAQDLAKQATATP